MLKQNTALMVLILASVMAPGAPAFADDVVDGTVGPGSLYRLVRPTNWNGMLVVYAHGTVPTDQPVAITPDTLQVMDLLSAQGFAVAASSYSENGWAVKDGAQRTHQLLGIFTSKFGRPSRAYVAGGSMGGLIAIKLVEMFPGQFAGALLACTPGGGLRANVHYGAAVWSLFDLFYPGVLPELDFDDPQDIEVTSQIVLPAIAAMTADPSGALAIASIDQAPVPFANVPELFQSIVTSLAATGGGFAEALELTNGKVGFDTSATQYTGALPPSDLEWINATIQRVSGFPSALNFVERNYTPTGYLAGPTLMLSTDRDPVVPSFHAALYASAVAATGNSEWLVQRSVPGTAGGYGHCSFSPQELLTAFTDLILWDQYGIKPTTP